MVRGSKMATKKRASAKRRSRSDLFIREDVFIGLLGELKNRNGKPFTDKETIYGDLSRLVVAWILETKDEHLRAIYQSNWGGEPNIPAIKKTAALWKSRYRNEDTTGE